MANNIIITANWADGTLSNGMLSRQYDNNRYVVQFTNYPLGEDEDLSLYLIVWMKTEENGQSVEQAPIELDSDQWIITNYYTQFVQNIQFQLCVRNQSGTFEAHSPIFNSNVTKSLSHDGSTQEIYVDPLFDAYKEYVDELVIGAGAVVIDSDLDTAGAAADAKATGDAVAELNERLEELEQTGGSGANIPTEVRQALYRLFNNTAFGSDAGFTSDIAVLQSWAMEITEITLNQSAISISGTGTSQLTAVTVPAGGLVTWSSSNPAVATVSSTGLVTGVSNGTARIIASCGGKNATCDVTVSGFATLTGITATFTQSGAVYDTDTLDSLKANLVVTANYDNSTSEVINNYTLSGTLSEGTSTITAAYGGKTATFTVTVTPTSTDVTVSWTGSGSIFNTGMIDARNADVYFSLPFIEGDSNLVSGATSDTVPVQIRVNVYDSADSESAYGFYYIDTETKVTTARTWAKTPNLPWNSELKIIPAGDFIKVQVNKPSSAPFTSNSACMAYLNAHGTTLKLRAAGGA